MLRYFAILLLASAAVPANDAVRQGDVAVRVLADKRIQFTLITNGGYVKFATIGDWTVIGMQSRLPVEATVFQIKDPADEGTPDSTNLIISLYQPGAADAQLAHMRSSHAGTAVKHGVWSVFTRQAAQGTTPYTVIDAEEPCADVVCGVRIAWPHLAAHAGYDEKMQALFSAFLDSVDAHAGTYQIGPDEVLRRPD